MPFYARATPKPGQRILLYHGAVCPSCLFVPKPNLKRGRGDAKWLPGIVWSVDTSSLSTSGKERSMMVVYDFTTHRGYYWKHLETYRRFLRSIQIDSNEWYPMSANIIDYFAEATDSPSEPIHDKNCLLRKGKIHHYHHRYHSIPARTNDDNEQDWIIEEQIVFTKSQEAIWPTIQPQTTPNELISSQFSQHFDFTEPIEQQQQQQAEQIPLEPKNELLEPVLLITEEETHEQQIPTRDNETKRPETLKIHGLDEFMNGLKVEEIGELTMKSIQKLIENNQNQQIDITIGLVETLKRMIEIRKAGFIQDFECSRDIQSLL